MMMKSSYRFDGEPMTMKFNNLTFFYEGVSPLRDRKGDDISGGTKVAGWRQQMINNDEKHLWDYKK